MKKTLFSIFFILCFVNIYAQTIKIKGCIKDLVYGKVYLAEVIAGKLNYLDSTLVSNGCFDFYVPSNTPIGMYSIVLSKSNNAFIRFILNNENVEFRSVFAKLLDSMQFSNSLENQVYYNYNKALARYNEKTELLKRLANLYTGNEKVLAFIRNETNKANTEIENLVAQLSHKYPSLLSVSFIKSSLPVKLPATGDLVAYKKIHYFDNVDFSNSAILRSDVISSLLQGYFSLYEDPSYTYTEQVENYALALDRILGKASKNKVIYEFLRTDLTNKYRYGNLDILGAYLMQFYSTDNFFPALIKEPDIKKRLQSLNHVSLGKQAPDIVMPTYDGKQERLKDIKTDYTLLVFWSTDCSHCTTMLPQLKQVYEMKKKQSDLEVLAVSFDTNQDAWQNFIKAGNYSWINYSDLKGWESEIARNYKIQGTPTYILLNKDKTVIYKPTTLEDLIGKLKTLNII